MEMPSRSEIFVVCHGCGTRKALGEQCPGCGAHPVQSALVHCQACKGYHELGECSGYQASKRRSRELRNLVTMLNGGVPLVLLTPLQTEWCGYCRARGDHRDRGGRSQCWYCIVARSGGH